MDKDIRDLLESATKCGKFLGVTQSTVSQSIRRGNPLLKKYKAKFIESGAAINKEQQ